MQEIRHTCLIGVNRVAFVVVTALEANADGVAGKSATRVVIIVRAGRRVAVRVVVAGKSAMIIIVTVVQGVVVGGAGSMRVELAKRQVFRAEVPVHIDGAEACREVTGRDWSRCVERVSEKIGVAVRVHASHKAFGDIDAGLLEDLLDRR